MNLWWRNGLLYAKHILFMGMSNGKASWMIICLFWYQRLFFKKKILLQSLHAYEFPQRRNHRLRSPALLGSAFPWPPWQFMPRLFLWPTDWDSSATLTLGCLVRYSYSQYVSSLCLSIYPEVSTCPCLSKCIYSGLIRAKWIDNWGPRQSHVGFPLLGAEWKGQ